MKKSLLTLVMTVVASVMAMAQVTTSSLSGIVTDADGEVIGATIQAIHTPSGTHYGTITNDKGVYAIRGMRVGGPYEVIVSYVGAETRKFEGINLQLGETYNLNVKLNENAEMLGDVVVVGHGTKFNSVKTGAATNISNNQIANLPTVSRSITDVARLSPYGGNGMSFAGGDGRMGNFTVDGANFNNNFGLSSSLPGGGNPISIDAIEEMQVVISPFDVRQTNFIGGGINAITKSGTNKFKGSAYVYHKNENMQGDAVERETISGMREKSQSTTWGFTLGGPIIKDKLFFFTNAEWQKVPSIANRWRGSDDGIADANNYVSRTKKSDLQKVRDFVKNKYGYDTGSFESWPADESTIKLLARIDWNINDAHHLAVRYNYTNNTQWNAPNGTSMDGGTRAANNRTSAYSMSFANSMYSNQHIVNSAVIDLNSRFSDNLTNQFLATFSKLDDVRGTNSSEFPMIDILDGGQKTIDGSADADGSDNYMSLGYELFTWNNSVHNTVVNVKDDATYFLGKHKITAGLNYEYQMADNQYMRNGNGYYRYSSLDDFLNGAAPQVVCLTYGYGGEDKPAARVTFHKAGVYAQDEWDVTPALKVTGGIRFDGLFFDNSDLMTNKAIYDLDYNGRHIDTGKWPNNSLTISPRLGFSWDILGDKSLIMRGGTGLFSGRLPLVFFTNMPTNSGMVQYQCQIGPSTKYKNLPADVQAKYSSVQDILNQFTGTIPTTVSDLRSKLIGMGYPTDITPEEGTKPSAVNGVDPDFKMPQVWKTALAFDYSFPVDFPMSVSAEGIFNKTINGVSISDWSIKDYAGFPRLNGADNRPMVPESGFREGTKAFVLENTSKGYGWTASATFNAKPFEWMDFMVAYTHTVSKELTSMPGSAAESAFTYVPTVEGPNRIKLHNSINVTPDRLIASLNLHDKGNNHYSFIYEATRGGYNASYMMQNDMNGDGYNYDALYIPTDAEVANGQFLFKTEDDKTRFMDYVHNNDYLSKNQGHYAEAYSEYSPWLHRVDFSYKHDFNFQVAGQKQTIQLSADIKNVMNLFNSSWGVAKYMDPAFSSLSGSSIAARILKYESTNVDGQAVFSTPAAISGDTKTWIPYHAAGQVWYASIGAKYIF